MNLELGDSWLCEPLRLRGVVLALWSQTIKGAPTSNTHPVCRALRLMPRPLRVLPTWNRKDTISSNRGFLFRHSNWNAEKQEGRRLAKLYLVIYDPRSPTVFRSGFAHAGGEEEMSLAPVLRTHS